jgi:Ca2+-binding RTX toxin-like protein
MKKFESAPKAPKTKPEEKFKEKQIPALELTPLMQPMNGAIASANTARTQSLGVDAAAPTALETTNLGVVTVQDALAPVLPSLVADTEETVAYPAATASRSAGGSTGGYSYSSKLFRILGTEGVDDITGTDKADFINGLGSDDKLRGGNGDDVVVGGDGNDIISGDHVPAQTTRSNDSLNGGNGDDKLFGRIGDDAIAGGEGNDQLFGGSGRDRLYGGNGNDQLFAGIVEGDLGFNPFPDAEDRMYGGGGNDFLDGGAANDVLDGSDANLRGRGEFDILTGGAGNDYFILANRYGAYYTQGGATQDFAVITDFQKGDRVRLYGNASKYVLGYDSTEKSTALGYLGNGSFELVGVFANQDLSGLSLTSSAFVYIS